MNQPSDGILSRLKRAQTNEEINALLEEARHFEHASDKTRRRWEKKAKERRRELEAR